MDMLRDFLGSKHRDDDTLRLGAYSGARRGVCRDEGLAGPLVTWATSVGVRDFEGEDTGMRAFTPFLLDAAMDLGGIFSMSSLSPSIALLYDDG